jgi:hypothetical protein
MDERPPATGGRAWLGAGVVAILGALALKAVIRMEPFSDGPLRHWYVQAGLVIGAVAAFLAGEWLLRRAYRPRAEPSDRPRGGPSED